MLFTPALTPVYPPIVTALVVLLVAALMGGAAAWHNHYLTKTERDGTRGPVEYEVVKGVGYTLVGVGLVYWPVFVFGLAAFSVTGGLMLWGARLREAQRRRDADAEFDRITEAQRLALLERVGRDA